MSSRSFSRRSSSFEVRSSSISVNAPTTEVTPRPTSSTAAWIGRNANPKPRCSSAAIGCRETAMRRTLKARTTL